MSNKQLEMYTIKDCTDEDAYLIDLKGRFVILSNDYFKEDYRDKKYQLVLCTGGFGCDPSKTGNAIFVKEINDDPASFRINRCDREILGVAEDSVVMKHKETFL